MKPCLIVLWVTVLSLLCKAPIQAMPSSSSWTKGSYVGNIKTASITPTNPPSPAMFVQNNYFFCRLPAGKGTAPGGFGLRTGVAPVVADLYRFEQKIRSVRIRRGGKKAILAGNTSLRPHPALPVLGTGKFRGVVKQGRGGKMYKGRQDFAYLIFTMPLLKMKFIARS